MPANTKTPHCSFCGESNNKVRMLLAGTGAYICDRCIENATLILAENGIFVINGK